MASDGTFTLRDGVLLRIADGVVIDVKGSLDAASATLQGPEQVPVGLGFLSTVMWKRR